MAESQERSAVTVRIGGEDHVIRANVKPEYTLRCAKWVDDRIAEIKNQLGLIESHKAAILAALSITDEFFQAQNQLEEEQECTAERVEALAQKLALALVEEEPELELALDSEPQE
jgi:cell division protein ZapA (FtsZ GTPase activity inhibitor)